MVCDSALYSQENLKLIEHLKWISRVPMTIKRAKELVRSVEIEEIDAEEKERKSKDGKTIYKLDFEMRVDKTTILTESPVTTGWEL